MGIEYFLQQLVNGICLGGMYALMSVGYSLVYSIMNFSNFAHGGVIMVGAYAILTTLNITGNPVLAIVVSIVVCTAAGIAIERLAYRPLRGASPLAVLITAIGVSYFLQSIAQLIFGAKSRPVTLPSFGNLSVGSAQISVATLITLVAGAVIMVALTLFVKFTRTGRAMQAVSEDRGAAQLMGVNVNRIIMITFAIGSALAAFASLFYLLQIPSTNPTLGSMPGIKAFTAAVIGGIGSIPGAMLGGVLLGLIEKICLSIPVIAPYTTAVEFSLLILILLIKPIGLLGKKRRVKV